MIRPERDNHYREIILNVQKSAEVIVAVVQRIRCTSSMQIKCA